MKNNSKNIIFLSIFIICSASVTLWGSHTQASFETKYPYTARLDITNNPFMPNKTCLIHDGHVDQNNKTIPGSISPIVSPQVSPEKPKTKEIGRGARGRVLNSGLARNLLGVEKEDIKEEIDYSSSSATIAATFNSDMSDEHKAILSRHIEKSIQKEKTQKNAAMLTLDSWNDPVLVSETIQELAPLMSTIKKARKDFPRVFSDSFLDWNDTLHNLKGHLENDLSKKSIHFALLKDKFKSIEEIREAIPYTIATLQLSYTNEKTLAAQEPLRHRSED